MAKLYIFGIGGTGSRVLRAFTYLLGAGVKVNGYNEVVPIVVDADSTSGDKTDAVKLMETYQKLYNHADHTEAADPSGFFATQMGNCCKNGFTLNIPGETAQKFKNYMNFQGLNRANRGLVKMLFSEKNLDSDMAVGFKGNPNIGSVVLNQFIKSEDFTSFANGFTQGDAVFIISSIFGGTGASGFPILLKNLRSDNSQAFPNAHTIAEAQIGAISVLPYFKLNAIDETREDQIDSGTFYMKTRAALKYYAGNLSELDHMYYIGDNDQATYENRDGGPQQKNRPNFIEFVAALSIFDFAKQTIGADPHSATSQTEYHEFGINEDKNEFNFSNLDDITVKLVRKPMTKLLLAHKFFTQALDDSWDKTWAKTHEPTLNETTIERDGFYNQLLYFTTGYEQWLCDMSEVGRKFTPFNLNATGKQLFDLVSGVKPQKVLAIDSGFGLFNNRLDKIKDNTAKQRLPKSLKTPAAYWLNLFSLATERLIKEKLKF